MNVIRRFSISIIFGFIVIFPSGTSPTIVSASNPGSYVNTIENNAAYFFHSNADSSKVMDIRMADYSNDNDMLLWGKTGWGNQRFVLTKADASSYFMIPLEASEKFLAIKSGINADNAKLVIRPEEYSTSSVQATRFKFLFNSVTQSFRIFTGSSGYEKYLALKNDNNTSGNEIVQRAAPNGNPTAYYEWKLEKTDNLTVDSFNDISIPANSNKYFNVRVPFSLSYVIETRTTKASLFHLYRSSDNVQLASSFTNTQGYQRLVYNLVANTNYHIWFSNLSSTLILCQFVLFPEKEVNFFSFFDEELNATTDVTNLYSTFRSKGYYLNHYNNAAFSSVISDFRPNGNRAINNDYFFIASHGTEEGITLTSPTSDFGAWQMPNMSNVKVAVWATCHGGAEGNAADVSVNLKYAAAAVGWPRLCFGDTSRVFTNHFWPRILDGMDVQEAFDVSLAEALDSWWFFWTNIKGDSIDYLMLYRRTEAVPLLAKRSSVPSSSHSSFENLETVHGAYNLNDYSLVYSDKNIERYVKLIAGQYSNDFYVKDKKTLEVYKSKNDISGFAKVTASKTSEVKYTSNVKILDSTQVYALDNGLLRHLEIAQAEIITGGKVSYQYIITDIKDGQILSFDYVANLFNS